MTANEASGNGLPEKFLELQTDSRAVQTEMLAGFLDLMQFAECSTKLEEQIQERDWDLQETHCELQVAHDIVFRSSRACFE